MGVEHLSTVPLDSARYKSLVNQIHPERCMDGRARLAFNRASEAYATSRD